MRMRLVPAQLPESALMVTSFRRSVLRTFRVKLSTGFDGGQPKSPNNTLCPYPLPFWSSLLAHVGLLPLTIVSLIRVATHRYLLAV
jgi:hypothetical protein